MELSVVRLRCWLRPPRVPAGWLCFCMSPLFHLFRYLITGPWIMFTLKLRASPLQSVLTHVHLNAPCFAEHWVQPRQVRDALGLIVPALGVLEELPHHGSRIAGWCPWSGRRVCQCGINRATVFLAKRWYVASFIIRMG